VAITDAKLSFAGAIFYHLFNLTSRRIPLQNLAKGSVKSLTKVVKFSLGPNILYTFSEPLSQLGH